MSLIQRFTNVEKDETAPVAYAGLFMFFILTALMLLRPAREALGMRSGLDAVRWLFVGTAVVTLAVNPVFGWMVSHFRRLAFITATYLFFAASLVVFYVLIIAAPQAVGEVSGRVFYVWYSVFNLFITMVFWALMADRFSLDQSKRLFAVIAAGGTLGAIFGPFLASQLAEPLGTPALLLISAVFLVLGVGSAWMLARAAPELPKVGAVSEAEAVEGPVIGGSPWKGFQAAFKSPYLAGILAYVLILAVMGTFLYFTRLAMVAERNLDVDAQTALFARIDMTVQISTLAVQLLIAGRLMKHLGVPLTLTVLPVTIALGMVGLMIIGTLGALVTVDSMFKAVQRGVMRPARETLFTVVDDEDKYKSKAVIDTFGMRSGDVLGAGTEGLLSSLGMGMAALAAFMIPLSVVWAGIGLWLGRTQDRLAGNESRRGTTRLAVSGD